MYNWMELMAAVEQVKRTHEKMMGNEYYYSNIKHGLIKKKKLFLMKFFL
jgi:hypothetical protein